MPTIADFDRAADVLPSVQLTPFAQVELKPIPWLWKGFIPSGMLTLLGGAPGCGKSTISLSFAATVSGGGQWPDGSRCPPGDVVVWNAEDPDFVTKARLLAAGADLSRVHLISGISGDDNEIGDDNEMGEHHGVFNPASHKHMQLLEEAMMCRLKSPKLLILDPIIAVIAGDSHKSGEVRRDLQRVVDLAQSLDCAVLGITHFSKGTAGREPLERVTGSLAFGALARVVMVAAKGPTEPTLESQPPRMLVRAKSNIGPDEGGFGYELQRVELMQNVEGQCTVWLQELDGNARDLLGGSEANATNNDGKVNKAAQWLRETLPAHGGSMLAADVHRMGEAAGHPWRTVQRAKDKAGVRVTRAGFGGGSQWFLVAAAAAAPRHSGNAAAHDAQENKQHEHGGDDAPRHDHRHADDDDAEVF